MATGSFYYPTPPSGVSNQVNGPWNLACEVAVTGAGGNLLGVRFWKIAADTGVHTATVYRTSDQAVLGQQAFVGESASGWQSLTLTTPIALPAGTYRVAVNHTTVNYGGITPGIAAASGSYALSSTGWALSGAGTGYPTSAFSWGFLVDLIVDGLPLTEARASQIAAEGWVTAATPAARVSQTAAEAWVSRLATAKDAVVVSQAAAEAWTTLATTALSKLVVSQVLAEVWTPSVPAPSYRLRGLSSQAP